MGFNGHSEKMKKKDLKREELDEIRVRRGKKRKFRVDGNFRP